MGHELTPKQNQWLKNELYGILGGIVLDDDCETLDEQLARDLYLSSQGTSLSFDTLSRVAVETDEQRFTFEPLARSKFGVVSRWVERSEESDEPEIVMICGSLFGPGETIDDASVTLHPHNNVTWPESTKAELIERYFTNSPLLVANQQLGIAGNMVLRPTFSLEEFQYGHSVDPQAFAIHKYRPISINVDNEAVYRLVPVDSTEIFGPTTKIEAWLFNGDHKIYEAGQ